MKKLQKFKSEAFSSGNHPPYHLIPLSLFIRTARRFEKGLKKYPRHNWKKGLKDKEYILDRLNHALEHLILAMESIENSEIELDDNLGAVTCNVSMAMEYQLVNGLIKKEEEE